MEHLAINEPIQVLVDFQPPLVSRPTKVIPRAFLWQHRKYLIDTLNLVHKEKRGDGMIYYFSVSTDSNTYKLAFHNTTLEWRLVEIWT